MALTLFGPTASFMAPSAPAHGASAVRMAALDDLKTIAKEQNPAIGYWDPFNLALLNFWGQGDDATVGFLRHAEIKHGRVAMAAFVGFIVQSCGVKFPGKLSLDGVNFADIAAAGGPGDQWDALPTA